MSKKIDAVSRPGADFFLQPATARQRQYEALRASFLERLPAKVVAERFEMTPGHVNVLKHRFRKGLLDFAFRPSELPGARRGTPSAVRDRIAELRRDRNLSAGQIAEIVEEEGTDVSVRTVERVLREAGFPKLPRRTRLLIVRNTVEDEHRNQWNMNTEIRAC